MSTYIARCEHCDREFHRRRADHRFCSSWCRHHASPHEQRTPVDRAAVDRLFDPRRDPDELVRPDDWFVNDNPVAREIYSVQTVATRRRGHLNLARLGRV